VRTPAVAAAALLAAALAGACSADRLERAAYESLHTVSDLEHGDDPRYRREPRDFDAYRRRRGEALGMPPTVAPGLPPPGPLAPASP